MGIQDIYIVPSLSWSILREIFVPPIQLSIVEGSQKCFCMEKFVRWIWLFLISSGWMEKSSVERRAKPSLNMKASRGLKEVTRTQMRRSNLCLSISSGFFMYFCTISGSVDRACETSSITEIPLPYDFPMGFMIQQLYLPSILDACMNASLKAA